nr:glycosyltransferase family 2 protein [Bifidobacterium sp. ESL0784]
MVIPTLNASQSISELIGALNRQSRPLDEVLVIDSSSDDNTADLARESGAQVTVIPRSEFDHGGTRHKAFLMAKTDYVLFMTQDALPANDQYVENLLEPFSDERIAMVSGRQLPRADARPFERLVRAFNYPSVSFVRDLSDLPTLGIKTFFASDACSAYRRTAYLDCGGFDNPCNTNEDMLMASKFIGADYKVAYAANAEAIHSHNLSFRQQYRRNKEIGIFLKNHKTELMNASEYGEGKRMVLYVLKHLCEDKHYGEIPPFFLDCVARYCGNKAGKLS